ncbi:MAG: UDP-N-acetylglucosamine 2-epimerase (non-hydrolyzing) [Coriobacteriia bacterium]|nr:UDP-N-acetylglucosamine 2-epimerase (non-hydrolyzing) [Coriobacteriia bacterium]
MPVKVLSIFGTRPEAIKMAPVVKALEADPRFDSHVLVTAQHREMLDQVLDFFDIVPDYDLDIMTHGQTLDQITSRVLLGTSEIFSRSKPVIVLVHGDTTTTFAAALSAAYKGIDVGHIEAGMRTGDIRQPFPEELNRTLVARLARWHFAPSQECVDNLLAEGINPNIIIRTEYNTGVSALLLAKKILGLSATGTRPQTKKILVTAHRRESWGEPMRRIFGAVAEIARRLPEYEINVATHANPLVADDARQILGSVENVNLIGPQGYGDFVRLMAESRLILSDSGGIQEEGPTLGVPVVVLRNKTEYHELLDAGVVHLAGTDKDSIVGKTLEILEREECSVVSDEFSQSRAKNSTIQEILSVLASGV